MEHGTPKFSRLEPPLPETSRVIARPGETFSRSLSEEKNFEFFLEMAHFGVLYIFERRWAPNVAGPGVTYPPPSAPPLDVA